MARYTKHTVDYFPHIVKPGNALFILEGRYGNDGYVFLFKLLETLCQSDGLAFDFKDTVSREIFLTKTRIKHDTALEMLNIMAQLNNIDPELWNCNRVIWNQDLVNNLSDVWRRRSSPPPVKPNFCRLENDINTPNTPKTGISGGINAEKGGRNAQSKVKERKGEGRGFSLNDNDNHNGIESDKVKTDAAAAPLPQSRRPAPLLASPASPSPEGSGAAGNNTDTTKKQFPEADIIAVAAAYCETKHMEFCNAIARSSYLRSKAVFYDAKDFLALNGGDVERACIAVKDFAREYEAASKKDWNWKYLLQDWSKPEWGNGITWDELRRNYELEQQQEKAR